MKKIILSVLALGILVGCTAGVDEDTLKVVDKGLSINHLCIKSNVRKAPDDFIDSLKSSLANKKITLEKLKNNQTCNYVLLASAKGNRDLVARATLRVVEAKTNTVVGAISYKRRGDEAERAAQVGLQGQTDLMVNELFKNY